MSQKRKVYLNVSKKRTKEGKNFFVIHRQNSDLPHEWIELPEKNDPTDKFFASGMQNKIGLAIFKLIEYQTNPGPVEYRMTFNREYFISGEIYGFPGERKKWVDFKIPMNEEEIELFLSAMYEVSDLSY